MNKDMSYLKQRLTVKQLMHVLNRVNKDFAYCDVCIDCRTIRKDLVGYLAPVYNVILYSECHKKLSFDFIQTFNCNEGCMLGLLFKENKHRKIIGLNTNWDLKYFVIRVLNKPIVYKNTDIVFYHYLFVNIDQVEHRENDLEYYLKLDARKKEHVIKND